MIRSRSRAAPERHSAAAGDGLIAGRGAIGATTAVGRQQSARMHALDGLRGLGALGVVFVHVWMYAGGDIEAPAGALEFAVRELRLALMMFFVLSGFLLYEPWVKAALAASRAGPSWRRYALRRVARVLPLYYVALVGSLAGSGAPGTRCCLRPSSCRRSRCSRRTTSRRPAGCSTRRCGRSWPRCRSTSHFRSSAPWHCAWERTAGGSWRSWRCWSRSGRSSTPRPSRLAGRRA